MGESGGGVQAISPFRPHPSSNPKPWPAPAPAHSDRPMAALLRKWWAICNAADDSLADCHRKALMVMVVSFTGSCGVVWGLCFCALGHFATALIPWAYAAVIATILLHAWATKRSSTCIVLFLAGIIVCPLGVHVLEGGYAGSSFVLLWAFVGPFIGLVFQVPVWVAALLFGVVSAVHVGAAVAEGMGWRLAVQAPPPVWVQCTFMAMNSIGPTGAMLLGACFFITLTRREAQRAHELLLNILPKHIIAQLTEQKKVC